jgi:hypothetical protein
MRLQPLGGDRDIMRKISKVFVQIGARVVIATDLGGPPRAVSQTRAKEHDKSP